MVLAALSFAPPPGNAADAALRDTRLVVPLAVGAACSIPSVIGTYFVKLCSDNGIMRALYKGLVATGVLSVIGIALLILMMVGFTAPLPMTGLTSGGAVSGLGLFLCALTGLGVTGLIVWITEYYTSTEYRPVRSVAQS